MSYPNTGSTLTSSINTGLSTQIIIQVQLPNGGPPVTVGAVKKLTEKQTRGLERVVEVGTDGTVELVPNKATTYSIDLERTVFDGLSLPEAFSQGFRNIQAQRFPFNVQIIDMSAGIVDANGDVDPNSIVLTTYVNCWFSSMSVSYSSDDYVIVQNASAECEYIGSTRAGSAVALSQAAGGGRSILTPGQVDPISAAADSRRRLSALDYPGLIRAGFGINNLT